MVQSSTLQWGDKTWPRGEQGGEERKNKAGRWGRSRIEKEGACKSEVQNWPVIMLDWALVMAW